MMGRIPGLSVATLDRGCCGMGGSFGLKRKNYELSVGVGAPLFEAIKEQAPAEVLTDCSACALQIGEQTGIPVAHPVTLLASACGLVPEEPHIPGAPVTKVPERRCAASGAVSCGRMGT
jgi:Fe-S oxidoreductase